MSLKLQRIYGKEFKHRSFNGGSGIIGVMGPFTKWAASFL